MNAANFIDTLKSFQSHKEYKKISRYFKADGKKNQIIGVRMKNIFDLAKEKLKMPLDEIEKLLDSPYYEARMGAVSILDFKAQEKNLTETEHKQLFDLYLNRHDRLNSWDFVDRAAPRVIGKYLFDFDKPRDILYELAKSDNPWERRTAIYSTAWFLKNGELDDTFRIAEILLQDDHEIVQNGVGTWLRHTGNNDEQRLLDFLEEHVAEMPRTILNIAIEKLDKEQKIYFRAKNNL